MSGASAGGLNGVLFAASQCYGFKMSETRDVWMRVGGLEQLVRTEDPRLSLLNGDRAFLQPLLTELTRLTGVSTPPVDSPAVDLILSATLTEPIRRAVSSPSDEPLFEDRFFSTFHFRNRPEAEWSSSQIFGAGDGRVARLHRMSLAARATSSFPGAFEAASVPCVRPQNFATSFDSDLGDPVNMVGVFGDSNSNGRPYAVADGGILDNIPIGKAIYSIQRSAAGSPTRRLLLYLHPTGPGAGAAQVEGPIEDPDVARSSLAVLKGVAGAKLTAETIVGDIGQLDDHNRAVRRARVFRTALFGPGTGPPPDLMALASAELSRYRSQRSHGDTQAVFDLISDPIGTIGSDPFPAAVGTTPIPDDHWRSPLAEWPEDLRSDWRARAEELFLNRAPSTISDSVFSNGTGPLERLIKLLIECARHLNAASTGADPDAAGPLRSQLYRVLAYVNDALRNPRDLAWVTSALLPSGDSSDGSARAEAMLNAADRLAMTDQATAVQVVGALKDPGQGSTDTLGAFLHSRRELLDNIGGPGAGGNDVDLRVEIVREILVPIASQLVALDVTVDGDTPAGLLYNALKGAWPAPDADGLIDPQAGANVLAALEVACFQEFLAGSHGSRIEFQRLSAANRIPIARFFGALEHGSNPSVPDPDTAPIDWIRPKHKLAGEEMANFSAFVRREWRANDWMWGRLDAVPTLVDELITPESMSQFLGGKSPEAALEEVKNLAGQGTTPGDGSWPAGVWRDFYWQQVWPDFEGGVTAEVGVLTAGTGPVANIRAALIAARQCEILGEELAQPNERNFVPSSVSEIVDELSAYDVGTAKIGSPKVTADVTLFNRVVDSAGMAVAKNVGIAMAAPGSAPSKLPERLGRLTQRLGRLAVAALLGTKWDLVRALWKSVVLLVLAAVVVVCAIVVESIWIGFALLAASALVLVAAVSSVVLADTLRSPDPLEGSENAPS
jgi:hypothetical protein